MCQILAFKDKTSFLTKPSIHSAGTTILRIFMQSNATTCKGQSVRGTCGLHSNFFVFHRDQNSRLSRRRSPGSSPAGIGSVVLAELVVGVQTRAGLCAEKALGIQCLCWIPVFPGSLTSQIGTARTVRCPQRASTAPSRNYMFY